MELDTIVTTIALGMILVVFGAIIIGAAFKNGEKK